MCSFLDINVSRTKEMIIDFRKKPLPTLRAVKSQAVGGVQQQVSKLTFEQNADAVCAFTGSSEVSH